MSAEHIPVLAAEAVDALAIKPDGIYVDGTFGRGGHSRLILARLSAAGRLIAFDRDPAAIEAGRAITDARFTLVYRPFSELTAALDALAVGLVDGILLDLGVSSPQLDEAERGFSFRFDAPLDMRMDTGHGQTAAEWLAVATEEEIREVIREYGEERFAKPIARALVAARAGEAIVTTGRLAQIIAATVKRREPGQHPATRSFQAIRIHINRELAELAETLPQAVSRLAPGGRLAVISFHSLEDRAVKRFLRAESEGEQAPARLPIPAHMLKPGRMKLAGRAVRAGEAELAANPRARSATLRVGERA